MWKEKETAYKFHVVENEGGATLGYVPGSGVKIIEKDGFAFKDLARCGELLPYEDWRLTPEERADDLAKRLSPAQIAGLMCYSIHQFNVAAELNDEQKDFLNKYVRSVLNSCGLGGIPNKTQIEWANALQEYAEGMDFGIPCYIASDPRNGQGVADWPGNLSLAATFDPSIAFEAAKCQSVELRNLGVACFLAPQVDLSTEPRWFRNNGTFGEDPLLAADMTRAFCDGLQSTYDEKGNDLGWGKDSLTAMVKHWVAEGAGEGGREAHLDGGKYSVYPNKGFEAMMVPFVDGAFHLNGKTKCASAAMSSYSISYTPDKSYGEWVGSSFSEFKIKHMLRERYGFEGPVCTDWMVLNEGKAQGMRACGWGEKIEDVNVDPGEKAFMAIQAGVDQMGGCSNPPVLEKAYEIGCEQIGKEAMDKLFATSARRLLLGYFRTGMFENPYLDVEKSDAIVNSPEKIEAALAAQAKAVVMLKNEKNGICKRNGRIKVYVPALYEAEHKTFNHVFGLQTHEAKASYPISLEVCKKYFDVVTDHVDGANITRLTEDELKGIDLILIPAHDPGNVYPQESKDEEGNFRPLTRQYGKYVADGPYVRKVSIAGNILPDGTKENRSYFGREAMTTNPEQLDQILEFGRLGKKLNVPSVVCMFTGKPLCVHEFEPEVDGIITTFCTEAIYGGANLGAEALARIVAGIDEPYGLLPMQMPKDMDDVERQAEDTPRDMECYTDSVGHKYDFAYGMNYSGVINDERVKKYSVPPMTEPFHKGKN